MKRKEQTVKYYNINPILSKHATYNMIIGERSNGKTYASLLEVLKQYVKDGSQGAIVRRWDDDFKGKRGPSLFDNHVLNNEIFRLTNGEWTSVTYSGHRWYLTRVNDNNVKEVSEDPFAYAFALTQMEHDKSSAYPRIRTIVFDEFISRSAYIPDEFVLFMNVISTIVRQRDDVTIFMLGNTVNKYCPYFKEMGLTHIPQMKQGTIDIYQYGESDLTVAVEYCSPMNKEGKGSDKYFAFNNPKLKMITGGVWEIAIYPHCPCKYKPKEVVFNYFIKWEEELLHCEVVVHDNSMFTFIHRKTTPLQDDNKDIIYSQEFDPRSNWRRKITKPVTNIEKKIARQFAEDKIFYQDNEVGEIVRNYLLWCGKVV